MSGPDSIKSDVNRPSVSARADRVESNSLRSARAAAGELVRDNGKIGLGSRVEVQLHSVHKSGDLQVRLRPFTDAGRLEPWSRALRVAVTDDVRSLLNASRAEGGHGLRHPSRLAAEVVAVAPRIRLRMFPQIDAASQRQAWFNAQLRAHLPEAKPLTATFSRWESALRDASAQQRPAALVAQERAQTEVQRAVAQILARLAGPGDLTDAARLSQAFKDSGLWLEALLAQAASGSSAGAKETLSVDSDLKAQLVRLAARVRAAQQGAGGDLARARSAASGTSGVPGQGGHAGNAAASNQSPDTLSERMRRAMIDKPLPGQARALQGRTAEAGSDRLPPLSNTVLRDVEGLLKQVVTSQLQSAEQAPDQQRWTFELPFQTSAGLFALDAEIEHQVPGAEEDEEHWAVQIRLDLPLLGRILIRLSYREDRLHVGLVGEQAAGVSRLRNGLPQLREQLEGRNLEVASLHAREGPTGRQVPERAPLLSETV